MKNLSKVVTVAVIGWVLADSPLNGQTPTKPGSVEIAAFGGVGASLPPASMISAAVREGLNIGGVPNSAITVTEGPNSKPSFGGSVGYAVNRDVLVLGEFAQTRIANPGFSVRIGGTTQSFSVKANVQEATANVHYQIPTGSSRFVPYGGGGFGLVRVVASAGASTIGDFSVSEQDVTYNGGGGARIYVTSRFGVRPEMKLVHIPGENYFRASVGAFFQFGNE